MPVASELDYPGWSAVLGEFFFDEAHAGEEILFAVDDLSLAEASGLPQHSAAHSLAEAVRSVITDRWLVNLIRRRVREWRSSGSTGPHPALPFLALTVLAASRMGELGSVASHNYYVPLRRLINPSDPETGAPGSFVDHIEWLWRDLAAWSSDDLGGRFGRLVVRDPGFYRFVGLAMQHALVRSADLRHLDAFFWRIGLSPGEEVPGPELRRALAIWARSRETPWGRRLARISADEHLADYCEALLEREAKRWDGRPRDPRTGRPVGRIRLGISTPRRRPEFGLYAQWDERLPERVTLQDSQGETGLSRWHAWYKPAPIPVLGLDNALDAGLEIRSDIVRFTFAAADAYAFSYDDDLGLWVSVDTIAYGDQHLILVREADAPAAVNYLGSASSSSPVQVDHSRGGVPRGWRLILDVRIDARPQTAPPPALSSLISAGGGPRLRLFGGLPISSEVGVYLRGGEPAVALSDLVDSEELLIREVSTNEVLPLDAASADSREVPLWGLGLEPGHYEIKHGESTLHMQVVDGIAETAGAGVGTVTQAGRDGISVSGTVISPPGPPRQALTVRAPIEGLTAYLLGADPEAVTEVALPLWISEHVGFSPSWRTIDAWPDFEPVWHLMPLEDGRYEAALVGHLVPAVEEGFSTRGSRWARLIASTELSPDADQETGALWAAYLAAAGVATS